MTDPVTAHVIAAKFGHAVEIESSRTATSSVTALPNGTEELTVSTEPVRVRQDDRWTDVDTTLQETDGQLVPTATATPVAFSTGGSGPLARVQAPSGEWVTLASPVGELPTGRVQGDAVTYPDVFPGVDLRLAATVSGMSEVLVVKSAAAAKDPHLPDLQFGVSGATVTESAATDAAMATTQDGTTFVSASPMWWDSSEGGDADGPGGAGLAEPVPAQITDSAVTVDASVPADAADVTYPVFVDPDWTGGTQAWTFVDARYPTQSYWLGSNHGADNEAHVGYIDAAHCGCFDGAHLDRTYWQIDTSGLVGKHVLSSHFDTQQLYSAACTSNVYQLNVVGLIDPATTWDRQPANYWTASRASLGPNRSNCATQYGAGWDATSAARDVVGHNGTILVLGVQADNEGDWTTWRRFSHAATLTTTYNSYPDNPTSPSLEGKGCATSAPGPFIANGPTTPAHLSVVSSDADSGQNLGVDFNVAYAAGGNALDPAVYPYGAIDSGYQRQGYVQVTLPSSLPDGAYMWNAHTYDGLDWSPSYSSLCFFRIDNIAPGAPVVKTSTTGTVQVGAPLTVTLGQRAAADGVVGFAYTWQPNAPTFNVLPSCSQDGDGRGIHFACGSSASLIVAPEETPQDTLSVWAFDGAGHRSAVSKLTVSTVAGDATTVYASAHQWTTSAGGALVPPADCGTNTTTVACVADTHAADPPRSAGQYPIDLVGGVTTSSSGQVGGVGVPGVLNFSTASSGAMVSDPGAVVDTSESYTVAAWLTPTAATGTWATAVALRGTTNSAFHLQLTPDMHWKFDVHSTTTDANNGAVAPGVASVGQPVYVAGVWDAVNREIRLYINDSGSPAAVANYIPDGSPSAVGGLTLGSAWTHGVVSNRFVGKVGNPVIVQGALTTTQLATLRTGSWIDNPLG